LKAPFALFSAVKNLALAAIPLGKRPGLEPFGPKFNPISFEIIQ